MRIYRIFCTKELNRPGTLIKYQEDGKDKISLLGDFNKNGGVCGCCSQMRSQMIVKAYAILYY